MAAQIADTQIPSPKRQKISHMGKDESAFRNYVDSDRHEIVKNHYRLMRSNQTLAFVKRMEEKWLKFDKASLTVREAFEELKGYVDSADPDTALPNLEHNLQTAEAIRKANLPDWFILVGLIHDMGKLMFKWGVKEDGQEGTATGAQYALGGDTWVVGCCLPQECVFNEFNRLNKDMEDPIMSSKLGIYKEKIGINNLKYAWGHDEYLYQFLVHNKVKIPPMGLAMVRFHSCYPMHKHGCYAHFYEDGDEKLIEWVLEFNKYDLYTKADERPDMEKLWPFYQEIIDKYMPGKLQW